MSCALHHASAQSKDSRRYKRDRHLLQIPPVLQRGPLSFRKRQLTNSCARRPETEIRLLAEDSGSGRNSHRFCFFPTSRDGASLVPWAAASGLDIQKPQLPLNLGYLYGTWPPRWHTFLPEVIQSLSMPRRHTPFPRRTSYRRGS